MSRRVPIRELLEPAALAELGDPPHPAQLRARLPRGWVPDDEDPHFARRDLRLLFREGWMLAFLLVAFGTVGGLFLIGAAPQGWPGVLRLLGLLVVVALAGGVAGPIITRALRGHR
jgi:hypothetical protein